MRVRGLALLCALAVGCSDKTTGILFVVDSDYEVTSDSQLLVRVQDAVNSTTSVHRIDASILPLSFLLQASPERLEPVTVDLNLGPGGATGSVRVGFVADQLRALPIFLEVGCRNVGCNTGFSCRAGVCGDNFVDVAMLPEVQKEGDELQHLPSAPDGGPSDAGSGDVDGADRGANDVPDIRRDTGTPDADAGKPNDGAVFDTGDVGVADTGNPDAGHMSCDPLATVHGCTFPEVCREVSGGGGICVIPTGSGVQLGDPCTATFNGGGVYLSDNCDPDLNARCRGAVPTSTGGTCVARCRPGETDFCTIDPPRRLANSECITEGNESYCLIPAIPGNDHGDECNVDTNCDETQLCLPDPYRVCSLVCSGTQACPVDFRCFFELGALCFIPCGDDSVCTNNDLDTHCRPGAFCAGDCSAANPCGSGETCVNDRCI